MPETLLQTKLYIPPLRPNLVPRPHLIERLNQGLKPGHKLTLISAPAGFGKTTIVSEWLVDSEWPFAWLSLDERDSDLTRFLTYFVAALRTIAADAGEGVSVMLKSPQLPPTQSLLTALLNDITTISKQFTLVLDDYHVVDSRSVDEALTFLLEHLPPQMHLAMTTREDPNLPLARWRARGQLTELRVNDLRFTGAETAEFLRQAMGLTLTEDHIATLEARTEGWIAGLQLAALSMQGREDMAGFIQAFTGDNRHIVDYLVEEVLQRQPDPIRSFLLQTAILDQLNGPLCAAVTGQQESKAQLEALEQGNFFIIPLDDKRYWYRYHHLFAQVLRLHLRAEQPDQIPVLHQRASEWYEQNGLAADAIRHALAGGDFERAAGLIELAWPALRRNRQEAMMLGWEKALPDSIIQARPVLSVAYAGVLLASGKLEGVEAHLVEAERWLDTTADTRARPGARPAEMIVLDEEEFRRLPGWIATYRAAMSLALGDVDATVAYAQRALDLLSDDDHQTRGAATGLLGLAFWTSGDLEAAYQTFAEGMDQLQMAGNISDAVGGVNALADIRIAQGRLRDAMRTYKKALQLAIERGTPALRGTADMYVGMSELLREFNDLPAARQNLLQAKGQGEHTGFPQYPYRWRVAMARLLASQGELESALDLLDEAERHYVSDFFPNVRSIAAMKARVWIAQGRLGEARAWAGEQGLSAGDELSYLREFEHITLARLLLAQCKNGQRDNLVREALELLERLLKFVEEGGRMGAAIEILILQALFYQIQEDIPAALAALERALKLAEPESYVRLFLDEGAPMAKLLREAATQGIMLAYARKLMEGFEGEQDNSLSDSPSPQPLVEPLTQRELEILRLFTTELSGPEIADELVIALSTVRTHTKAIYNKLNVNSRRSAVNRAVELGLI